MADLSEFLKSLQELHSFNHLVDMDKVIRKVYELEIFLQDFEGT